MPESARPETRSAISPHEALQLELLRAQRRAHRQRTLPASAPTRTAAQPPALPAPSRGQRLADPVTATIGS